MKRVTYEYGDWDPILEMSRKADALPKNLILKNSSGILRHISLTKINL